MEKALCVIMIRKLNSIYRSITDLTFILSKKILKNFSNLKILYLPEIIVPLDYMDIKPFIAHFSNFQIYIKKLYRQCFTAMTTQLSG